MMTTTTTSRFASVTVLDKMEKKIRHKFISTRHVLPPSGGVPRETRSRFTRHKESAEEAKDFFGAFVVTNSIVVIIIVGPFEEYGNNNNNNRNSKRETSSARGTLRPQIALEQQEAFRSVAR
jgi:hypothetical protein